MHSILLVDDEPHITDSIKNALRHEPYRVFTASSGNGALQVLQQESIDVVVSDELMPGLSGIQLLTKVRLLYPETSRVLLTGDPNLDCATRAINDAAVFQFLTKPCAKEALVSCLSGAIAAKEYQAPPRPQKEHSPQLAEQFQRALQTLWIAYQPVVEARSQTLVGYEALLRTEEPSATNPLEFLSMAHSLSFLNQLERSIWQHIAADTAPLEKELKIFVNLTTSSITDDSLYDPTAPLSQMAGRVVLEISEKIPFLKIDDMEDRVDRLSNMGFQIAVDDLGTGPMGLTSLSVLHPQMVKFDLKIVHGVDQNPSNKNLLKSYINICGELGIRTIAEGVETVEERDQLLSIGCSMHQGYLFCHPQAPFPKVHWP